MSEPKSKIELFHLSDEKEVFQCSIFSIKEQIAQTQDKQHKLNVYTLACTDWVNIIPVTSTGEIVFVEQHRFGVNKLTLEVPGGAVETNEKDLTLAALRELEEETGLTTKRLLSLPGYSANAAMQNNRVTYFIALDVHPKENLEAHGDPFENIAVHLIDIKTAMHMARTGQITHSLSALALLLAEPYLNSQKKS